MPTQFTATVKPSGGDYTSLSNAVTGLANDITSANIKVFSISASTTPTIVAGDTVLGQTSLATGVCVLVNAARNQILIKTIVGTYFSGEVVQKTGVPTVTATLSNSGDSPIIGIECYSMSDTTEVSITGYTTSVNNYIYIYTPRSERHNGKWDSTKYRLETTWAGIYISTDYVRIDGIQLQLTRNGDYGHGIEIDTLNINNEIRISNCIISAILPDSSYHVGIYVKNNNAIVKIWNNILYGWISATGSYNIAIFGGYCNTIYAYNNTTFNNSSGYELAEGTGAFVVKNNISYNNTINYNGSFDPSSTNNLSGPQLSQAPGLSPRNGPNMFVSFVDETNYDFHLATTDVGARNYGIDLSADPYLAFTNDIDGQTRPGTVWDIGADQISSCPVIGIQFTVS